MHKTNQNNLVPSICPKCNAPLKWDGVHLICTGDKCIAQLIRSVAYFYSPKGIKIDGIGEKVIGKLLANQKIYETFLDHPWALLDDKSYGINIELLLILGKTIYGNLLEQIFNSRDRYNMAHFISGLGLPGISYKTALRLCQYIKSGQLNIPVSKKAIASFFDGLIIFDRAEKEMKNFSFMPLPGKPKAIYCITGILSQARDAMIEYFSDYGYEFSGNVTRETNYLIVGASPGKTKVKLATKNNIPQITEEQFIKLLTKEKQNDTRK